MTETIPRADLLRRAAAGGAALVVGGVAIAALPRRAGSAPSKAQDATILALTLTLEQAQQALYEAAAAEGAITGDLGAFIDTAAGQEATHVATVRKLLGPGAADPPAFDFGEAVSDPGAFVATAIRLENISVQSYNGQVANLTPAVRAELARIVSVDARHAGWMRGIEGDRPAGQAVDAGASAAQTEAALAQLGIVAEEAP